MNVLIEKYLITEDANEVDIENEKMSKYQL